MRMGPISHRMTHVLTNGMKIGGSVPAVLAVLLAIGGDVTHDPHYSSGPHDSCDAHDSHDSCDSHHASARAALYKKKYI